MILQLRDVLCGFSVSFSCHGPSNSSWRDRCSYSLLKTLNPPGLLGPQSAYGSSSSCSRGLLGGFFRLLAALLNGKPFCLGVVVPAFPRLHLLEQRLVPLPARPPPSTTNATTKATSLIRKMKFEWSAVAGLAFVFGGSARRNGDRDGREHREEEGFHPRPKAPWGRVKVLWRVCGAMRGVLRPRPRDRCPSFPLTAPPKGFELKFSDRPAQPSGPFTFWGR